MFGYESEIADTLGTKLEFFRSMITFNDVFGNFDLIGVLWRDVVDVVIPSIAKLLANVR